jgi:hypothetical protein
LKIRLFGDPTGYESEIPVQSLRISIALETPLYKVAEVPSHNVVCDFVGGWAMGTAVGVGVRSVNGWWTVKRAVFARPVEVSVSVGRRTVKMTRRLQGLHIRLLSAISLAPTQTRIIALELVQIKAYHGDGLEVTIELESGVHTAAITTVLPVKHHLHLGALNGPAIKATYFFAGTMPTAFLAIPPTAQNQVEPKPPLLSLREFNLPWQWSALTT